MTSLPTSVDSAELLRKAVANPFEYMEVDDPTPPIRDITAWYRLAREKAPLWCFNKWAFRALRSNDLPSSYPLRKITQRIAEDEGFNQNNPLEAGAPIGSLLFHVFSRRVSLSEETGRDPTIYRYEDGSLQVDFTSGQSFRWIPDLDTGSPEESEYWEIGCTVTAHVEALEAANTRIERQKRRRKLDEYLSDLGTKLSQGAPEKGAPQPILEALFHQGNWLFGTCWKSLPSEPSEDTRSLLQELGASSEEHTSWAVRLALPMLSVTEITALRNEIDKPLGRRHAHTSPRRFTVFSIAHRLDSRAKALARRLPPESDADEFFGKNPNPIRP